MTIRHIEALAAIAFCLLTIMALSGCDRVEVLNQELYAKNRQACFDTVIALSKTQQIDGTHLDDLLRTCDARAAMRATEVRLKTDGK